jgi:hypothetical protein
MMSCIAVVLLNGYRVRLAYDMTFRRQDLCERIPVVSVEGAIGQVFYLAVETLEGLRPRSQ